MDKLNQKDINRVKETLKTFISKTAGCEDSQALHQQALAIFGKEFADKPALIKQAASAYNSNKSIFKLSNDETANTDFGLLEPDKLYKEATKNAYSKTIEKAANAQFAVRFFKDEDKVVEKVASAPADNKSEETPEETMSDVALSNYMKEVMDDRDRVLIKSASRRDICAREALDCYESFERSMNAMTKEARAQVAKHLESVYPVDGKKLMEKYRDANEMQKIASYKPYIGTCSELKGDIYTKAQNYLVAEFAKEQADRMFKEAAADTVEHYKHVPGLYKLYKKAASGSILATAAISQPIAEALYPDKVDEDAAYQSALSAKLLNELRAIEAQNVLVDMYSEPFIASYPADDIEAATIQAMQMLPAEQRIHPRKHTTLLKTWVADILGRGGNVSSADADKILTAARTMSSGRADNNPANLSKDAY